jgi:hypothetical protein
MRPRLQGCESEKVIKMVQEYYTDLSPTQLIQLLINNHYQELYPRGEEVNGKNKADKTDLL